MTRYINKLPPVFQTTTEKKFFDATVQQVFSKKDSDLLSGFIGRRDPGLYNPVSDFYLPEPTKNRTWWQLEATAFARNADGTKSNIFFYDDLLNRVDYYGGNTANQDRLFESAFYSWAPPIDYDMFMNYYNYYWIEHGLLSINIDGLSDDDIDTLIVGRPSYNTSNTLGVTPANLTFTTGIKVQFVGSVKYPTPLIVENIGGDEGIRLVPQVFEYTTGAILEFLPWDGTLQLASGRTISNPQWDVLTWDTQPQPGNSDYITIERGALDKNAWSRTNNWYHIEAIKATIAATGAAWPSNATHALRPIIQFSADIMLYRSGVRFRSAISYGLRRNADEQPILLADLQGELAHTINEDLGIELVDGQSVVFMFDPGVTYDFIPWDGVSENMNWDILPWVVHPSAPVLYVNQYIFISHIDPLSGRVTFVPSMPIVTDGDIVFATEDSPFDGSQRGETWYYNHNTDAWLHAVNDKVAVNQPPLFQLYDHNGIPLDDEATYPMSTFAGSKIFTYKLNTRPGASVDPVLKFPIVYTSLGQATDIMFQNSLITDRYVYSADRIPVNGYYYYSINNGVNLYNDWNLYTPDVIATYELDAPLLIAEGSALTVTLTTTNIPDGTLIPYTITGAGITQADINGSPLTGDFAVFNNMATLVIMISVDMVDDDNEILHIQLDNGAAMVNVVIR